MSELAVIFVQRPGGMVPGFAHRPAETGLDPRSPGWRVLNDRTLLLESFARAIDAELAKRALEEAGLDTYDKIEAYIAQHGRKAITRIMCEALQW